MDNINTTATTGEPVTEQAPHQHYRYHRGACH